MEENSEVYVKYQKLALEYSKLKAQSSVLKSAITDEQNNVVELQEALKKKDQLVRKLEQEVECLNFRNVQLTKRVSVLQTDLEGVEPIPKHSKSAKHASSNHTVPLSESYNVLNSELQSRIEENEKLHQQLYSAEFEYEKKVSELSSTVDSLKAKLESQERKFTEKTSEQETAISTMQKEKVKMQVNMRKQEKEIKERRNSEETKTRDITSSREDLATQLEEAKRTIAEKVIFNDSQNDSLNSLNVPLIQRSKHAHLITVMLKLQGFVSEFSRQLSDLHTFMMQRLCANSSGSIKAVTAKLDACLRESIPHLKAIPSSFEKITSAIKTETMTWDKSSVNDFSSTFQKYEKSLDKALPYLILRIQNQDSWKSATPKLIELIPKLVSLSKKVFVSFKKLDKYILLLAVVDSSEKNQYNLSQASIIKKILESINLMQKLFEEARSMFGSKISLEHKLPMLSQSEKSTDECILATLVSLTSTLRKIMYLIEKDIKVFSSGVWYKSRNSPVSSNSTLNPSVWKFKERGGKYIELISEPEQVSIPYETALKEHHTLSERSENLESLTQQLEEYQKKLMELELEKYNWMLDCQLIKAKESQVSDDPEGENTLKTQDYDEIQLFVKNTINELIKKIQYADSKAIAFKNECENMHQNLELSLHRKEELEKEMKSSKKLIEKMKEEQNNLKKTYDDQLNTMSEHLANLNETLTAQKDEIDALKHSEKKGSRKGKTK